KSVDLPVYQLLGGKCRDRVKVFENVVGETLLERVNSARGHVADGYTSLRMTPFYSGFEQKPSSQVIDEAVAMVAGVREGIGYGIDLGLEIHRNLRIEEAITLARELEPYRILYYEDPLAPESVEGLEIMARSVRLPVATGERFHSIQQFKVLIDRKLVSLIRPDVSLVGGFTQIKKVAAIAESAFVGIFPHLMGSAVNNAAFTHFAVAIPNYVLMESNAAGAAVVDDPMSIRDGYRIVSDRPGIGVEIDEDRIVQYAYKPVSITGHFHYDGSVAH
ncbi:MAG: mandelate racemase/muconate lactonizing enzyme family protein, partial [Verrucomicrobiota bacterium]|nr:mandelate racemase/muconate lactonizing enzyme family protein [Verrucomicrobiota bacterium]